MRKITTILLLSFSFLYATEGFGQRGIGTNLPDRSSVLELESETRGLLIPRFDLEALNNPSPVIAPANSLLVYNTKKDDAANLKPGYYYWVRDNQSDPTDPSQATPGKWIPLLNTAGNNIEIDDNGVVSVKPGESAGEVLVTVDDGTGALSAEWIPFHDFVKVLGRNGVTVVPELDPVTGITTYHAELGGDLIRETTITTTAGNGIVGDPNEFDNTLTIESGDNKFFITDLNDIEVGINGQIKLSTDTGDDGTGNIFKDTFDVLIVNKTDGLVQRVSVEDLLKDAIAVKNGLHYDPIDGFIKLGGDLTQKTIITLDGNDFVINTDNGTDENGGSAIGNLIIEGLEETATANKIMVVDENNTVRTVRRVISKDITSSFTINTTDWSEYSSYVQEVNITVSGLSTTASLPDIFLTLPTADPANEGQIINVSLTNTTEAVQYLVIKDSNSADVTWGALPFQGWVLKSDGNQWRVVSSN